MPTDRRTDHCRKSSAKVGSVNDSLENNHILTNLWRRIERERVRGIEDVIKFLNLVIL